MSNGDIVGMTPEQLQLMNRVLAGDSELDSTPQQVVQQPIDENQDRNEEYTELEEIEESEIEQTASDVINSIRHLATITSQNIMGESINVPFFDREEFDNTFHITHDPNIIIPESTEVVEQEVFVEPRFNRFKDATWFPKEDTYTLIGGAGGIGGWLVLFLSRAGFKCYVYDFDTVEIHNLGTQFFRQSDIGKYKVDSLSQTVKIFTDEDINTFNEPYDENSLTDLYVFSAFDNMKARQDMFSTWLKDNQGNPDAIFLDGRLLMEQLTIYCIRGDDTTRISEYQQSHLFNDSEVAEEPCTMKQTSHTAAMIASMMLGFFTNHLSNRKMGVKAMLVPFRYEFLVQMGVVDIIR